MFRRFVGKAEQKLELSRRDATAAGIAEEEAIAAYLQSVLPADEQDPASDEQKKQDGLVMSMLSSLYMSENYASDQRLWSAAMSVLPGVTRTPDRAKVSFGTVNTRFTLLSSIADTCHLSLHLFTQTKAAIDKRVQKLYWETKAPWDPEDWQNSEDFAAWLLSATKRKLASLQFSAALSVAQIKQVHLRRDRMNATTKGYCILYIFLLLWFADLHHSSSEFCFPPTA